MHQGRFVEVHVSTPVEVCSERDVKGLYAKQRSGEISGLTGVDDPKGPPHTTEVHYPTHELSFDEAAQRVLEALKETSS
jgi:adenylylsulfate kinase